MQQLAIIFFLLFTILKADSFTLKEIETMPKSISKDYYIWRFLQEKKTTKKESIKAYSWTKRRSHKLKKAIRKKVGYLPSVGEVPKKSPKDPNNYIIYPANASKKSHTSLARLYKKIREEGKYSDVLKVMANKNPFEALKTVTAKTQAYIFNGCETKYRKKHFNHQFSKEQLSELAKEKQFNATIFKIVTTHSLQNTKKSLIYTASTDNNLSVKSLFLLAINAVEFSEIEIAKEYLSVARTKAKHQSHKDQCDFWLYLLTKRKSYLNNLIGSNQVNIYTLSARDILKKPYPKVITPNLGFHLVADIDPHSPIDWEKIKIAMKKEPNSIEKLAERYNSYLTEGIYTYLKEKATKYKKPYYAMPYRDAMIGKNPYRVALLYALGRQESRFVPASISTSYALGMMQIMPFLIKHLAKERGEKFDLNEMFNPYTAISYADQHLDYLTTYLYHPLFIAYGYNGGIGFTKRSIKSSHLFKTGKYEPYLSMELIDYEEAREYGKKVLTNYIIYLNIVGVKTRLAPFLEILDNPFETDKFR